VVLGHTSKPVFVAYPASFDFTFVYWYLIRFTGHSPFSHSALDIKTYAMARLKAAYRESTKRNMPKCWFERLPHTHRALDDAIEQGALFCNMLTENLSDTLT
jgi:DNA polymerase III alpha subunit (gram-positive type)